MSVKKFAGRVLEGLKNFGVAASVPTRYGLTAAGYAVKGAMSHPMYSLGMGVGLAAVPAVGVAAGYGLGGRGEAQAPDLQTQVAMELQAKYPELSPEQAMAEAGNFISQM